MNQRDDLSHLPTREPPAPVAGNAFVYILACSDGALYVGSAGDVTKRMAEHGEASDSASNGRSSGQRISVKGAKNLRQDTNFC
jgi:GIY-YIG catalytic domain